MTFKLSSRLFLLLCFIVACSALRLQSEEISSRGDEDARPLTWRSKWDYVKSLSLPGSSFLWGATEELESCEEVYGIFPCSTTFGGNLFLLVIYGYMLLKAAQFLSDGSELLLLVSNPGIVGGLLLPILGALPDALLILVSGLSASAAAAQSEVLVGMGLLAGSNIILLTAVWGGALILGRCDLINRGGPNLVAKDRQLTNGFSLSETGVTTDQQTRVASWIMMITVLPYLVAQTPKIFGWSKPVGHIFVLVGCVICLTFLAGYCFYQVAFPWVQEIRIERARGNAHRASMLHQLDLYSAKNSWGGLLGKDNQPNQETIARLFAQFDDNNDNHLSKEELKGLLTGLGFEKGLDTEVSSWIKEFDLSTDEKISKQEFVKGMVKWMTSITKSKRVPKRTSNGTGAADGDGDTQPHPFWRSHSMDAQSSLKALTEDLEEAEEEEQEENHLTKANVITKAVLLLVTGALIAGISADPLVNAIQNFSTVTGISPFFISFVATPIATSSSEALSSLTFAMKKKKKNISMTYSQIYGSVTMNNTMCLAVFLAIVYARGLTWDFSSEVLVILVATVVIGALASVRVTFPLWMAIVALLLYPFSIALVAVLDYAFGWQ